MHLSPLPLEYVRLLEATDRVRRAHGPAIGSRIRRTPGTPPRTR